MKIILSPIIVMFSLLISTMVHGQGPQLFGFNDKDAQVITIKNTSASDSADDFHLRVKVPLPGLGGIPVIKKVKFIPGGPGQVGAFKDTVFSQPHPTAADWAGVDNNFKLGPGEAMRVQVWGNGVQKDSTYLTKGGVPISTNNLRVRMEINKTGGGAGSGTMKIVNEEGVGIILQNVTLHINNTNIPFDSVTYSPNGTLVPAIPFSMFINPGDSVTYSYLGNLVGNWITLHFFAATTTAPGEYYEMGAAANEVNTAAIPTLPQWGLILLSILLLITGVFFIRRTVV